jgi:hypothetical protein
MQTNREENTEPMAERMIKSKTTTTTILCVIAVAMIGIVIGIFSAGIYWSSLPKKLDAAYDSGVKNIAAIEGLKADVQQLLQLKENLTHWNATSKTASRSGAGGGSLNDPSMCPEGTYMVGLQTTSNVASTTCIGCLTALQAVCRPLKTE